MEDKIIACPTLRYELEAARKEFKCQTPIHYIPQQLHNDPEELHKHLQNLIDHTNDADRLIICVSSCGGGTANLQASNCDLIVPRTRDCVDILLSGDSLQNLNRPMDGCLFTKGWVDFNCNSEHSLENLTKEHGKEYAENFLRRLYAGFNKFYFVDTGLGHLEDIQKRMAPLVKCLDGSTQIIKGNYGILKKIAKSQFDEDFQIVPKGSSVDGKQFISFG